MQFLVICRPDPGGDPEEFKRLVPFEAEVMREQKARGTLTGAWSRTSWIRGWEAPCDRRNRSP